MADDFDRYPPLPQTIRLEVVELATDKVVRTLEVSHLSARKVETVMRGLLHQTDREKYFVREVARG